MFRPGWFFFLVLHTIFMHGIFNATKVLMSYRALELGGGSAAVGILTSVYSIVPLFLAIYIGRKVDRGFVIPVLWLGTVLSTVSVAGAALSPSIAGVAVAAVGLGTGQLLMTVGSQAVIPSSFPAGDLTARFGSLTLGVSIGQTLGMPIAGLVAGGGLSGAHVDPVRGMWVMCAFGALAIPCMFGIMCRPRMPRVSREMAKAAALSPITLLGLHGMKPAILASMSTLAAIDLMSAYLPVLGQTHGISVEAVTLLLTVRTLATIVARLFTTQLTHTVGLLRLLWTASLLAGLCVFAIPVFPQVWPLALMMVLSGFAFGMTQPLTMTLVSSLADAANRGAVMSLRLAGNRLSQVAFPLAASALSASVGVAAIFVMSGGLLVASAAATLSNAVRGRRD
ncbi:MFS transporter [Brevibacterium sp. 50QC2O2]|uniref:MFS transporter n=1 Tax=unclassified Brevibacterium TaxID=2614124 RepID=UPI00211CD7F2|nr:MFS transporter [Brevibacterium sp. 91QC2O2]MCQ9388055.1 MFS transporter [Brevibacterium sp. 50QC2O2]